MHVVTSDLVSTKPQGGTTAYDVIVVGVTHKDGFKGAAAARAKKKKHEHHNNYKKKCRDEGKKDSRLAVELIPLALEATGAVGNEVNESGKDLKHAYEIRVLPISNASAAAAFNGAWVLDFDHPPIRYSRNRIWGHPRRKVAHERGENGKVNRMAMAWQLPILRVAAQSAATIGGVL